MSSGFVSGGTTEQPIERDDEWLAAQKEIEATRRRKEEEAQQDGGKSLYEVLQNNKGDTLLPAPSFETTPWLTCQVSRVHRSRQTRSF